MSELSSHSLFHYTRSLECLQCIIKDGLRFSMIGERIPGNQLAYFVPSISFCNIPLSKMSEHAEWYGHYAIGVKPYWVKLQGGTPVVYCHSSSPIIPHSRSDRYQNSFSTNPITPFLKQTRGKATRAGVSRYKDYIDEKEWRIIDKSFIYPVYHFDNQEDLEQIVNDEKEAYNPKYLKIPFSDIEYIMLEKRSDLPLFIFWLKNECNDDVVCSLLISKILIFFDLKRDI